MSNIRNWSTTPANNNSSPPNGAPEGMAPSTVNDIMRQQMADHKTQWTDAEWFDWGDTVSRASASTFKITTDVTSRYTVGRRIKCYDASTIYATITAATYSAPDTTITVGTDSGSLSASLSSVALSILSPSNKSIPTTLGFKGADVASSATTNLANTTGDFVDITGTTTITALGTADAGVQRTVRFTGALTLTHNATSLILPGGSNITTANGDTAIFRSLGSGNWICVNYSAAAAAATPAPVGASYVTLATNATLTSERVITAGTNITLTDNGAGSTLVIASTATGGAIDTQTFTSSGTWNKPGSGTWAIVQVWGAGGSGASSNTNALRGGGAGGGSYVYTLIKLSSLGSTESVTIGAGGTAVSGANNGNAGGLSTFGSWVTGYGGGGGGYNSGGSGAGAAGAGGGTGASGGSGAGAVAGTGGRGFTTNTVCAGGTGGGGGTPGGDGSIDSGAGGGGTSAVGGKGYYGGAGGGGAGGAAATNGSAGGTSIYGGGGGGGGTNTGSGGSGGTSLLGGSGGAGGTNLAAGTAGTQPGGGGGGTANNLNSGAGGAGQIIVTVI